MRCNKCNKPLKENTEGNLKYCQGHSIFENICQHSWIDADNEGFYGKEICRFCGEKRRKYND